MKNESIKNLMPNQPIRLTDWLMSIYKGLSSGTITESDLSEIYVELKRTNRLEWLTSKDFYGTTFAKVVCENLMFDVLRQLMDDDYGCDFLKSDGQFAIYELTRTISNTISAGSAESDQMTVNGYIEKLGRTRDFILSLKLQNTAPDIYTSSANQIFSNLAQIIKSKNINYGSVELSKIIKKLHTDKYIDLNGIAFIKTRTGGFNVFSLAVSWISGVLLSSNNDRDDNKLNDFEQSLLILKDYYSHADSLKSAYNHQYIVHKGSADFSSGVVNEHAQVWPIIFNTVGSEQKVIKNKLMASFYKVIPGTLTSRSIKDGSSLLSGLTTEIIKLINSSSVEHNKTTPNIIASRIVEDNPVGFLSNADYGSYSRHLTNVSNWIESAVAGAYKFNSDEIEKINNIKGLITRDSAFAACEKILLDSEIVLTKPPPKIIKL